MTGCSMVQVLKVINTDNMILNFQASKPVFIHKLWQLIMVFKVWCALLMRNNVCVIIQKNRSICESLAAVHSITDEAGS